MSPSSSSDDEPSSRSSGGEEEVANKWVVRLLLVFAFGVAFGIEGMTLIRSYVHHGEEETERQAKYEKGPDGAEEREGSPLRVGSDLLPPTAVSERITEMKIRVQSDGPWIFRLGVTVVNGSSSDYHLSLRNLKTDDEKVFDEVYSVECPPGDTTHLVATWSVGTSARPQSLTAEARLRRPGDSIRTVSRHVSLGHVPVQMER